MGPVEVVGFVLVAAAGVGLLASIRRFLAAWIDAARLRGRLRADVERVRAEDERLSEERAAAEEAIKDLEREIARLDEQEQSENAALEKAMNSPKINIRMLDRGFAAGDRLYRAALTKGTSRLDLHLFAAGPEAAADRVSRRYPPAAGWTATVEEEPEQVVADILTVQR